MGLVLVGVLGVSPIGLWLPGVYGRQVSPSRVSAALYPRATWVPVARDPAPP